MLMEEDAVVRPLNLVGVNPTSGAYTETRSGFSGANPAVGTVTHTWRMSHDPWSLTTADGRVLFTWSNIFLSLSKVFNPDNSTTSFLSVSFSAEYDWSIVGGGHNPPVDVATVDATFATQETIAVGNMNAVCGNAGIQSFTKDANVQYFDRVQSAIVNVGQGLWYPCPGH